LALTDSLLDNRKIWSADNPNIL